MLEGQLFLKTVCNVYICCRDLWLFSKYCALTNVDLRMNHMSNFLKYKKRDIMWDLLTAAQMEWNPDKFFAHVSVLCCFAQSFQDFNWPQSKRNWEHFKKSLLKKYCLWVGSATEFLEVLAASFTSTPCKVWSRCCIKRGGVCWRL